MVVGKSAVSRRGLNRAFDSAGGDPIPLAIFSRTRVSSAPFSTPMHAASLDGRNGRIVGLAVRCFKVHAMWVKL